MAVQVFPFIYTALFIFLFTAYSFSEGVLLDIIDYAGFVSPIVVVAHLVYSKMLMMCKWHRIACALPLMRTRYSTGCMTSGREGASCAGRLT